MSLPVPPPYISSFVTVTVTQVVRDPPTNQNIPDNTISPFSVVLSNPRNSNETTPPSRFHCRSSPFYHVPVPGTHNISRHPDSPGLAVGREEPTPARSAPQEASPDVVGMALRNAKPGKRLVCSRDVIGFVPTVYRIPVSLAPFIATT